MYALISALVLTATMRAVPYTLERLELDLTTDYVNQRIDGTARLTVRNTSLEPARDVPLLLGRLLTVKNGGAAGFEQHIVTFEDDSLRQVNAVTVHLERPLPPGSSTTVAIDYGGHIVGYTETGSRYIQDHVAEDFTIIREDAYSFPTLGVPSQAINRKIARQDFTFDARVTVPNGFVVAAGSLVGTESSNGTTTYHFASNEPAPFLNLSIAKFGILESDGIRVYYLPQDEAGAKLVQQKTRDAMTLLTKWFGPLSRPPKLAIIEIPENWGSQAALIPGIILTADSFRDPKYLFELYHELGHLWNPPDLDKPSPRLNEGLSEWLQWTVSQELDALNPESMARVEKKTIARAAGKELAEIPLSLFGSKNMTDWSYSVGHLYFAVLDRVIGRNALLGVIREWYQSAAQKGATLHDFTSLLERRYPQAAQIDGDWITSTRWIEKLNDAGSLDAVAARYRSTAQ